MQVVELSVALNNVYLLDAHLLHCFKELHALQPG